MRTTERGRAFGRWRFDLVDAKTGLLVARTRWFPNVLCTAGYGDWLAQALNGEAPTWGGIYVAVGTGAGTPAKTDTQLFTELARVALSANSRVGNAVTLTGLFGTADANGTLTEAGVFINGTAAANSGSLISHALISETKTSSVNLIAQVQVAVQ